MPGDADTNGPHSITAVACTVCGCVCDDLTITIAGHRIVSTQGACPLAEPWFLAQNTSTPPAAEIAGLAVPAGEALSHAADLLRSSRSPLIYGLSRSTTEGQRAAVALAEVLGATIDTTASTGHAPSIIALQQVGESTCTLGEVKNRADLVIFWGSDPITTHPRHLERYSLDVRGRWVPGGRTDRHLVVLDEERTPTAGRADQFIPIAPGRHWETITMLRMLVRGLPVPDVPPALLDLAQRMKNCRCGIVFFGTGLTRGHQAHRTIEALLQLITELNAVTRFYVRRMRRYGDVAGADSVLAWQTGFPFGVNFARGFPRYNPGEFTGPDMLRRGEIDVCLLVGSETAADFPQTALEELRRIPVIVLDPPGVESPIAPAVRFRTAVYGVHRPGTAYRMDEVPIPLRVLLPTDYPSDGEVLGELLGRVDRSRSTA